MSPDACHGKPLQALRHAAQPKWAEQDRVLQARLCSTVKTSKFVARTLGSQATPAQVHPKVFSTGGSSFTNTVAPSAVSMRCSSFFKKPNAGLHICFDRDSARVTEQLTRFAKGANVDCHLRIGKVSVTCSDLSSGHFRSNAFNSSSLESSAGQ
ncbi:hypothetical protein COCSUDRAFT_58813 [Coccomyxa subellipsoidea C-169]|uniref:Uncharacterized protein n=1 Tax=Coccomyxa subellipsoidea (strain C-169) TaxID=574566 RepID=I0Z6K1_COCSC|nr:hypothetical protein COCSUDRAFT_58813 [Coccomyxa subellipsoidea C-169]EIE26270.1 hypothetical protein COCSUDRAFT_58813 [Coccomyxa subellipsoidea C-169]|eukprot:XP_005650814.1 hypothetical protein COCSUDRAFT_58813 [Coccomyxa subellipsoidea C-169]